MTGRELADIKDVTDPPLHARVAAALGCTVRLVLGVGSHPWWRCECADRAHMEEREYSHDILSRYDTDWSATGPLIEKYRISLAFHDDGTCTAIAPDKDHAYQTEHGKGALVAVCNLILLLKETGRLEP